MMIRSCTPYNGIYPTKSPFNPRTRNSLALDVSGTVSPQPLTPPKPRQQPPKADPTPKSSGALSTAHELQQAGCWANFLSCLNCFSKQKSQQAFKVTNEKGLREFINDRRGKKVKTILVEQQEQRKTLVLDLDETLVHSSYELEKWDFKTNFEQNGQERTAYTKVRYGLDRFLETMSQHYQLIAFTGGFPDLACKVLDQIDPNNYIKHRVYRQNCIQVDYANKIFLKNLSILNRNLSSVVLLDNSKNSGLLNPENLLLISSFYQDESDRELVKLIPFLVHLAGMKDVRVVEQRRREYFREKEPEEMVRSTAMRMRTVRMEVNFENIVVNAGAL